MSLAITALMMTSVLSMLALSIDLGHLYVARSEAQRAADAAALAGASAFVNYPPSQHLAASKEAERRARTYVLLNPIRGKQLDLDDDDQVRIVVEPEHCEHCVRVTVRPTIPLWFAQLLGMETAAVAASATAGAVPADRANCIAPLAFDFDWDWAQQGAPITIAPKDELVPGVDHEYVTLDFVDQWEHHNFAGCDSGPISIEPPQSVPLFPDPPRMDWAWELMNRDANASWDADEGILSEYGWDSPRIITIMLYKPSSNPFEVAAQDFLLFFIDDAAPDTYLVRGRFLAYASGAGDGPSKTARSLQLTR